MALNINPLVGIKDGLNVVRIGLSKIGQGLSDTINNSFVSGRTIQAPLTAIFDAQGEVFAAVTTLMGKVDELNTFLSDKMAFLDEVKAKIGSAADGFEALERRMGEYADDRRNQAVAQLNEYKTQVENWANAELRPRLNSLEQYRTDVENYFNQDLRPKVNSLRADVNNVGNVVNAMTNDRINAARAVADDARARVEAIYTKLPKRTPEEQWAYFSNLARPTFEKSMDWAVQNSLWNLRNNQAGSLEWDGIAEAANAAMAGATENASRLDAKLAEMIAGTNDRTLDIENNQLPKTTLALNKRIDEAKSDLERKLSIETQISTELKRRMDRMELQIDKVAPLLARIPQFPGGGG